MSLKELIKYPESDWLDFKQKWYDDTADLILDILCMANADADNDRYIVIGYNDKEKSFHDITQNRRNRDDFFNILNTANFNRIPNVYLDNIVVDGNELDIITICKTKHRPYFLIKDKNHSIKTRTVRAGVIYSRTGSSNTSVNDTATESLIVDMWRERFGLNLSPKERLEIYVEDIEKWQYVYDDSKNGIITFYYIPFPEFTIEYEYPENMKDYSNPSEHANYLFAQSIGNSYEAVLKFKYHSTILKTEELFICDKMRYNILCPKVDYIYYNPENPLDFHVFANNADISNRGSIISEIDYNRGNGIYHQIRFCYNIKDSFIYYVQMIINSQTHYDIYRDYIYFDETGKKGGENETIKCPNRIYCFQEEDTVLEELSEAYIELQTKN